MSDPLSHPQMAPACDAMSSQGVPSLGATGTTARIDPPHRVGQTQAPQIATSAPRQDAGEPGPVVVNEEIPISEHEEQDVERGVGLSPERIRRHARQIAAVLRRRQEQLDHREAQLNAQRAQLENDIRVLRLLWQERHAEWEEKRQLLAEREAALAERRAELGEREEALSQREQFLAQWEEALRQREANLAKEEQALQEKRQELARREAEVQIRESDLTTFAVLVETAPAPPSVERSEGVPCERQADGVEDLIRKQDELTHYWQQAKRILSELEDARERWKEQEKQWRQQWVAEQRQAMAELAAQREAVARRSQALDRLHAELLQLKKEVDARQREAIEHHLAACELTASLERNHAPAEVAQRLIALRQKLDQTVKMALEEREDRHQQTRTIETRLQSLHRQIVEEKRRFDKYMAARLKELEDLAAKLADREKQLVLKESELHSQATAWQLAELGYILEIRRLRECLQPDSQFGDLPESTT